MTYLAKPHYFEIEIECELGKEKRKKSASRIKDDIVFLRCWDASCSCEDVPRCWLFYDEYVAGKEWRQHEPFRIPLQRTKKLESPLSYWSHILKSVFTDCVVFIEVGCDNEEAKTILNGVNPTWYSIEGLYHSGNFERVSKVRFSAEETHYLDVNPDWFDDEEKMLSVIKKKFEDTFKYRQSCAISVPYQFHKNPACEQTEWLKNADLPYENYFTLFPLPRLKEYSGNYVTHFYDFTIDEMRKFENDMKKSPYFSKMRLVKSQIDRRLDCKTEKQDSADREIPRFPELEECDHLLYAKLRPLFNHKFILNICVAFANIFPPIYVVLEIIDWIPHVEMQNRVKKVKLIEQIYGTIRKIRETREARENGHVALRTRKNFSIHSIKDPTL